MCRTMFRVAVVIHDTIVSWPLAPRPCGRWLPVHCDKRDRGNVDEAGGIIVYKRDRYR